jgi:hypothetical protein
LRYRLLVITVLGGLSGGVAAQARSVDAGTLDVAGVKTGMDYDQVVAGLAGHFQVPPTQIKPDPFQGENMVTHTACRAP